MSNNIVPIVTVISPASAPQGSSVSVEVVVNEAPKDTAQPIVISSDTPGFFVNLPGQVAVPVGNTSVTFQVALTASAVGAGHISATSNSVTKTGICVAIVG